MIAMEQEIENMLRKKEMKFPEMELLMVRYCKQCGLIANNDTVGCPICIKDWFKQQKTVKRNDS